MVRGLTSSIRIRCPLCEPVPVPPGLMRYQVLRCDPSKSPPGTSVFIGPMADCIKFVEGDASYTHHNRFYWELYPLEGPQKVAAIYKRVWETGK